MSKKKNDDQYILKGEEYEPYLKEKKQVSNWVRKKINKLSTKSIDPKLFLDKEAFAEYGNKYSGDFIDGYVSMFTGIRLMVQTIPFAADIRHAIDEVFKGYDIFFPSEEECKTCGARGEKNRKLFSVLAGMELQGDVNNLHDYSYYITSEGPLNRYVTALFGAYFYAGLYLPVLHKLHVVTSNDVKKFLALFDGGMKALQEFKGYIDTQKFQVPEILQKYSRTIINSKYGQYGIWTESCFLENDFPLLRRAIKEPFAANVNVKNCQSLIAIKSEIKRLMMEAMTAQDMAIDERNGYLFFLACLDTWIGQKESEMALNGDYVSTLLVYIMGGFDKIAEAGRFCNNNNAEAEGYEDDNYESDDEENDDDDDYDDYDDDYDEEYVENEYSDFLDVFNGYLRAYKEGLIDKDELLTVVDSEHPKCVVFNPQILVVIRLAYWTNILFTEKVEGFTDDTIQSYIKDYEARALGFSQALYDLSVGFLGLRGVRTDLSDDGFFAMAQSFIDVVKETSKIS